MYVYIYIYIYIHICTCWNPSGRPPSGSEARLKFTDVVHTSRCVCNPCAGAVLMLSVSFPKIAGRPISTDDPRRASISTHNIIYYMCIFR